MKKLFVVLALLFASSNALDKEVVEQFVELIKSIGQDCMAEVGASEADMGELMAKKIPTSHEGKCVIFCVHKYFKVMSAEGKYQPNEAIEALAPLKDLDEEMYNKSVEVAKACENVEGDADPCLAATKVAKCGMEESKKRGLAGLLS